MNENCVNEFCSGSAYGPNVRKWTSPSGVANIGHCFIALDVNCFAPDFENRMGDINNTLRNLPAVST